MDKKETDIYQVHFETVMGSYKKGILRDGHGKIVTDAKQARAIAHSEGRRAVKRTKR